MWSITAVLQLLCNSPREVKVIDCSTALQFICFAAENRDSEQSTGMNEQASSSGGHMEMPESKTRYEAHMRVLTAMQESMITMASCFEAVDMACILRAFCDLRQEPTQALLQCFVCQTTALAAEASIDPRSMADLLRRFAYAPASIGRAGVMRVSLKCLDKATPRLPAAELVTSLDVIRAYFSFNSKEADKVVQEYPQLAEQLEIAFLRTHSKMHAGQFSKSIAGLARLAISGLGYTGSDSLGEAVSTVAESESFQHAATEQQLRLALVASGQLQLQGRAMLALQSLCKSLSQSRIRMGVRRLQDAEQLNAIPGPLRHDIAEDKV